MTTVQITKEVLEGAIKRGLQNETIAAAMADGYGPTHVQALLSDLNQTVVGTPVLFGGLLEAALRGLHVPADNVVVRARDDLQGHSILEVLHKTADTGEHKLVGWVSYIVSASDPTEQGFSMNANVYLTGEAIMAIYRLGKLGPFRDVEVVPPGVDAVIS